MMLDSQPSQEGFETHTTVDRASSSQAQYTNQNIHFVTKSVKREYQDI